ncbi:putative F-box/LRR-repeat protein [Panicum miliaceum]|uniref:F-box/LRR-repeat protein n=1 Tax=Panicum miliaceum TaxID=4540 RepID=A0A3L6QWA3_PANMI|nr:putative F-box/LRR-repeat protein [Panicum miliaceum]
MEDRLSSLPDDLLHSILRDLPLKHAARTSALSRRWVPQWIRALADSPVLDFTDRDFARGQPADRAAATVGRCLRLHAEHGAPLDAFRVALVSPQGPGYGAFGRDVIGWIAAAVARSAREVEVDLTPSQEGADHGSAAFLELPGDLFRSRSSLERLALGRLSLRAVPLPAAGLAGLRSLSLSHTDVTDEALRGVLATCRALESLSLRCCSLLTEVSVASERLQALELLGCRAVRDLRVAAPALESFAMYGYVILSAADWCESVAVDFAAAPALRDVYLSHMDGCDYLDPNHDDYYPFVYHVPHPRVLTLCSVGLLVPRFSLDSDDDRFDHLPYAHVNGGEATYIDMPNLQELQLLLGSLEEEGDQDPRYPERVYYFFHCTSLPVLERLFIRLSSNPANGSSSATASTTDEDEDDDDDDRDIRFGHDIVLGQLTFIKVVNFRGTWRERRLVGFLLKRAPILEQLVLVTPEGGGGAPGYEHVEGIQEWVSALQKASREARTSVCRPSEDDSPNHVHTRFFHEEYCCMRQG